MNYRKLETPRTISEIMPATEDHLWRQENYDTENRRIVAVADDYDPKRDSVENDNSTDYYLMDDGGVIVRGPRITEIFPNLQTLKACDDWKYPIEFEA